MTDQERLVRFCSALGLNIKFDYNDQNKQFETFITCGTGHYRGAGPTIEISCKAVLADLKNTVSVCLLEDNICPIPLNEAQVKALNIGAAKL